MGEKLRFRPTAGVIAEVTVSTCDACGKSQEETTPPTGAARRDMHRINLSGGYGDHFPMDGEELALVVCGPCLQAWVNTFSTPVKTSSPWRDAEIIEATHTEADAVVLLQGTSATFKEPCPSYRVAASTPRKLRFPSLGVYQHFKGSFYEVVGNATLEDPWEELVVYRALYGDSPVFVRPLKMWDGLIVWEGYQGPRFRRIGY